MWTDPGFLEPRNVEIATALHLIACALLGARELAELRAQNSMDALTNVEGVFLYPGMMDPRSPRWVDHFIAFVKGACELD